MIGIGLKKANLLGEKLPLTSYHMFLSMNHWIWYDTAPLYYLPDNSGQHLRSCLRIQAHHAMNKKLHIEPYPTFLGEKYVIRVSSSKRQNCLEKNCLLHRITCFLPRNVGCGLIWTSFLPALSFRPTSLFMPENSGLLWLEEKAVYRATPNVPWRETCDIAGEGSSVRRRRD